MRKQEKVFTVDNLKAKLNDAKIVVLVDYQGLNVSQMGLLRNLIKKAGGELQVVKNTLLNRTLENPEIEQALSGPTAVIFGYEDEIPLIKAIYKFAQTAGLPTFKSGLWEDRVLAKEEIEQLGTLPTREELIGKLISLTKSPLYQFNAILSSYNRKLIIVLKRKGVEK